MAHSHNYTYDHSEGQDEIWKCSCGDVWRKETDGTPDIR